LAVWSVPAILAVSVWVPIVHHASKGSQTSRRQAGQVHVTMRATLLLAVFSTAAFLIFWAVLSWLPSVYQEEGWDAASTGLLMGAFTLAQIAGSSAVSVFADRVSDRRLW